MWIMWTTGRNSWSISNRTDLWRTTLFVNTTTSVRCTLIATIGLRLWRFLYVTDLHPCPSLGALRVDARESRTGFEGWITRRARLPGSCTWYCCIRFRFHYVRDRVTMIRDRKDAHETKRNSRCATTMCIQKSTYVTVHEPRYHRPVAAFTMKSSCTGQRCKSRSHVRNDSRGRFTYHRIPGLFARSPSDRTISVFQKTLSQYTGTW